MPFPETDRNNMEYSTEIEAYLVVRKTLKCSDSQN